MAPWGPETVCRALPSLGSVTRCTLIGAAVKSHEFGGRPVRGSGSLMASLTPDPPTRESGERFWCRHHLRGGDSRGSGLLTPNVSPRG